MCDRGRVAGAGTLVDERARVASPPAPRRPGYEPALDGVRALAVIAVLVYHDHGPTKLGGGGFLGVDLFFVLSGYLITTLLLRERATTGGVALGSFWRRRAQRLLPALLITIAMALVYFWLFATPPQRRQIKDAIVPALFYFQNWHVVSHQGSVLGHTWSLAIEEQWYLVWPVVLWIAVRRAGRATGALLAVVAAALVSSTVWTAHVFKPFDQHAYYGSDTRVQGLLVGALVALVLARYGRPTSRRATAAIDAVGVVALVLVVAAFVAWRVTMWFTFRGGLLVFACLGAALLLAATQPGGRLRRVLSLRPFVFLGLISYGIYLYSLPIFATLTSARVHVPGFQLFALRSVVTVTFAYVSWRFVEQPFRRAPAARVWPWAAISGGIAVALVAALAVQAPAARRPARLGAVTKFLQPYSRLAAATPPGSTRVLVVGGSEADGLDALAHPYRHAPVFAVAVGARTCGVTAARTPTADPAHPNGPCAFAPGLLGAVVRAFRPKEVVVTMEAADTADRVLASGNAPVKSDAWRADATAQLDLFLHTLHPRPAHVVLVGGCGPAPAPPADATARADAVWRAYARAHAGTVRFAVPPAAVCRDHHGGIAMWQWLEHLVGS